LLTRSIDENSSDFRVDRHVAGCGGRVLRRPPALSWYTAPGGLPEGAQIQAIVQIPEVIRYATGKLMRGQLIGGGIGGVFGLVVGIVLVEKKRASQFPTGKSPAIGGRAGCCTPGLTYRVRR